MAPHTPHPIVFPLMKALPLVLIKNSGPLKQVTPTSIYFLLIGRLVGMHELI